MAKQASFLPSVKAIFAALMGFGAALLPLHVFAVLLGSSLLGAAFLIEPALALVVTLSVAPLKTLIETESPLKLPLDVGQLTLFIFIGVWAVRRIADRKTAFRYPKTLLIAVGYFILMASFSLWTAYSTPAVITELLKWVQILMLIFIVANLAKWEWVLFGVVLSAALQAIIGLWEFQGGSGAAHLWILDYQYFRAFGTFGQPNPFGAFMGMVLPLGIGAAVGYLWSALFNLTPNPSLLTERGVKDLLKNTHFWLAVIYGGMSLIILAGLLASWSRGAWLGFLGAITVMIFLFPPKRRYGFLALAVGGLMVGLLWVAGLLPAGLTQRLTSFQEDFIGFRDVRGAVISDENFAVLERLAHWQSAIEMANTNPILGVGFGNYESAYPEFALINWQNPLGHAHNYYLNILAETGLIGFHSYFIMWGLILTQNWRLLKLPLRQRGIAVGLMGVWTHITIHSFLDKLYVNNLFLHIGVMLGLLAVLQYQEQLVDNRGSNPKSESA